MLALPRFPKTNTSPLAMVPGAALRSRLESLAHVVARHSLVLLRMSLGLVFIWFGALKIFSLTPVGELVAATVPFVPAGFLLPALGTFEVLIGLGLLVGRYIGLIACVMAAHLMGTFLVLVTQPEVAFVHSNPLQLTMTGEFVIKNIVLITASLVLATATLQASKPASEPAAG